ncbi:MAG: glycosyltransferase [Candidatus Levybacteria bacterium]|nr:glycosyltransferase [Candidatus Levybacteria bacterium]
MNKKKIAMISLHTCPLASQEGKETGGINVYVLELSKELANLGYKIDIFTRSQSSKQPKVVRVSQSIRVIHLRCGPEKYISKKKLSQYVNEFVKSFYSFVNNKDFPYSVIHCHYYLSGLAGLIIKENSKTNIPLLMTFHTLAFMKNLVARDELEREEKERIDAEVLLVKKSDKIIASSENDKLYLKYLYNCPEEKLTVVNPGVNTEVFKPIDKTTAKKYIKADSEHKIILFVGRIEPLKGIDSILYAMKILLERDPELKVCLWIVGGDVSQRPHLWSKELQKLEKLRKLLNITAQVKFVGQRPQKDLPFYYNASELVVMPSHYESFGMAALEAMACAVPVITTSVAGISTLFDKKHESLITTANNPLLLASQIDFYLTNNKALEKVSKDVLEKVQDFKWSNIADEINNIYKELINR